MKGSTQGLNLDLPTLVEIGLVVTVERPQYSRHSRDGKNKGSDKISLGGHAISTVEGVGTIA